MNTSKILKFQNSKIPSLIIFDCDGTLVDSEYLYNAITAELLNDIGLTAYTPELCIKLFAGHTWSNMKAELEKKHQKSLPDGIIQNYADTANKRMETELQAVPHIHGVLEAVQQEYQICVASNGQRDNVFKSLKVTGLMQYFDKDRIFTKIQVENGKPAPDIFLYALKQMGIAAENAVVLEDSVTGVTGAVAAGIKTYGYTGTAHDPDTLGRSLIEAGADEVLPCISALPVLLNSKKP